MLQERAQQRLSEDDADSGRAPPFRALVVDDEAMIGRLVQATLAACQVEVTVDPTVALDWLAERSYDLILCDLAMPEMSGIELYQRLSARRPNLALAFVLMTGSAFDETLHRFLKETSVRVLRKPFTVRALQELVAAYSPSRVAAQ